MKHGSAEETAMLKLDIHQTDYYLASGLGNDQLAYKAVHVNDIHDLRWVMFRKDRRPMKNLPWAQLHRKAASGIC